MTIPISTTIDKIFKQYLVLMNGVLSREKRLSNLEIDVLEKMLYIDHIYRHLPKNNRDKILFHTKTRERIRESVYNISPNSYNNVLSKLRKKGMLIGNTLGVTNPLKDKDKVVIEFRLELNAE